MFNLFIIICISPRFFLIFLVYAYRNKSRFEISSAPKLKTMGFCKPHYSGNDKIC